MLLSQVRIIIIFAVKFNTLRPRQNGRHFADDIFKCIFLDDSVWIPIEISLKFVPKGPINNIPALVQIMAWRRLGDKPLSETIMVSLPTHICVTRPQWVEINITFTKKDCFESQSNWKMNQITPSGYAIDTCIFHCFCLDAHNQAKFQYPTRFGEILRFGFYAYHVILTRATDLKHLWVAYACYKKRSNDFP